MVDGAAAAHNMVAVCIIGAQCPVGGYYVCVADNIRVGVGGFIETGINNSSIPQNLLNVDLVDDRIGTRDGLQPSSETPLPYATRCAF